ncbi:hypothetical protein AMATHDRAFT_53030 [Amanita thiersii Skay4041]|uniref:Late embryogenesis abundant protein LEA-2 subgroup domain-containing protein n=1 Tax=Amanita thiersii Skay4041 TaxID=703135 RepID=A0A2A9P0T4_9AGAR|nr:hypothetical protein AMATHDRAFT_53030 [Amanita thiersii Skay4041]
MTYGNPYGNNSSHNYNDSLDFNPYNPRDNTHHPYGQEHDDLDTQYRDNALNSHGDMSYPPIRQSSRGGRSAADSAAGSGGIDQGEFSSYSRPGEKSLRGLKDYRRDYRGNLWTKGSRGHCIGRFCCCTLLTSLLLIVSILLALALWIRPPNVTIGKVDLASSNALQIQAQQGLLTINLGVNITVDNPNYFAVNFKRIKAEIFYPINNTNIGGGELKDIVFHSNQETNVTFPFAIQYKASDDPQYNVLRDLAQKCGVGNGVQSNINVNYKITLGLRILFITISPVVSNSMNFACPADPQEIQDFLKGVGIDPSTLGLPPST